jgi:hypothetical protein
MHPQPIAHAKGLHRLRWSRIIVAVLVAGTVPAILINVFVLDHLNRPGTQLLDFALHLLPLVLGAWAAGAWQGKRPRLLSVLGVATGAIEALIEIAIFSNAGHRYLASLFGAYTVPAIEDYVAVPATIALFISGALTAERRKRESHAEVDADTAGPEASPTSGPEPRKDADRLITLLQHPATTLVLGVAGIALQAMSTFGGGHA